MCSCSPDQSCLAVDARVKTSFTHWKRSQMECLPCPAPLNQNVLKLTTTKFMQALLHLAVEAAVSPGWPYTMNMPDSC